MHETHLVKNIFKYLDKEERSASKRIIKIYILLSEFGGISEEHFNEQYKKESQGTKWESLKIQIKKVPYGPELEIARLDFE
jgi:Zn finger protein HypA/HybF involved in hydrogenase expression